MAHGLDGLDGFSLIFFLILMAHGLDGFYLIFSDFFLLLSDKCSLINEGKSEKIFKNPFNPCAIVRLEQKENIEQGTRNVQCRGIGVLDLAPLLLKNFDIQNSLFNIQYSLRLRYSTFLVQYSLFP